MNRWQEIFISHYYKGRAVTDMTGKMLFEQLGNIDRQITVHMPEFAGVNGIKPAHEEKYTLSETYCDTRNGIITVPVLCLYLKCWVKNGYRIEYGEAADKKSA